MFGQIASSNNENTFNWFQVEANTCRSKPKDRGLGFQTFEAFQSRPEIVRTNPGNRTFGTTREPKHDINKRIDPYKKQNRAKRTASLHTPQSLKEKRFIPTSRRENISLV